MVEIRKLKKDDMEELFALLNTTFGTKYGRPMHFDLEQPKMWVKDDLHMERHIAVFEDGRMAAVVGIYPLPAVIGGEKLLFCTTGNVATLPQYEGKGYFSKIFPLAIEEARKQGAVSARLGGARQRYGRYGFEPCGPAYEFRITDHNAKYTRAAEGITLEEIKREDEKTLAYCNELMKKKIFYVERSTEEGYRDVYLELCSKEAKPFLVKRNGAPIGYISAKGNFSSIFEFSMENEADILAASAAVCRWRHSPPSIFKTRSQAGRGTSDSFTFKSLFTRRSYCRMQKREGWQSEISCAAACRMAMAFGIVGGTITVVILFSF